MNSFFVIFSIAAFFLVIVILFKRQITSLIAKASKTKIDLNIDLSAHEVKSESHQVQKEGDLMSFMCVYCDQSHPMSYHSFEHIIPRALGNKGYVLPNACKFINNYMACSFEKRIINSEVMKEIQLIAYPPKEPYFRRNIKSSLEPHLAHYVFPTGENIKVQKPHDIEIDIVHIRLFGEKGEELIYELKLPFPIVGVKGATALISPAHLERRLKKFNTELENYISELFKNPSINLDFFEFIKDNNINLDNKIYDRENRKVIPKIINNSPLLQTDRIIIFFDDEAFKNWENATVCLIKLYGGILEAEILLSEKPISINFSPLLKIDL